MRSTPPLTLLRYGILGLPLAFAGLPVYVHVPKFYAEAMGVDLAAMGALLLILRLGDTVLDPIIGVLSDRFRTHRRIIMAACVPVLALGYGLLFNPPDFVMGYAKAWLGLCLALVYLSFSTIMINYYALGVDLAGGYNDNTRVAAWREGSMLIGVLLASLLPPLLMQHFPVREAYRWFSLMPAPLLILCAALTLSAAPPAAGKTPELGESFFHLLRNAEVRWVLTIALANAIPGAITSTLFLFFTGDVLHAEKQSGLMLCVYFLSAAAVMPLWTYLSARTSKRTSLLSAMVVAIVCFVWAWGLKAGDIVPFYIICVLSGMTVGADMVLLPSLFADALSHQKSASATGFGLWNLTSKLTMALAAGIALPVLAAGGYHAGAGNTDQALARLSFAYALLPCLFKAVAAGLLYISPIDKRSQS